MKTGRIFRSLTLTVVCMLMHERTSPRLSSDMHTRLWRTSPPAAGCFSSLSFSCSELSPRGLRLRCPAVSSGAQSEKSAAQSFRFWSDSQHTLRFVYARTQTYAPERVSQTKCVKNVLTFAAVLCCEGVFSDCFLLLFFSFSTWKSELGGCFTNMVPSGLLSRAN